MNAVSVNARIERLLEALRGYQPECVYLFGSAARGEADELSDLDVVVIKPTQSSFFERLQEVGRMLPAEAGPVDVLVYTPEEFAAMQREGNAFAEMVAKEGLLVYGRSAKV
ncbi:MAG: nucleotidyltransferase domain-containing protein [Nitrospirae bacterium]|nr:nucleotidyltransferase domain-containing protein [Nitrospirota bacterium]